MSKLRTKTRLGAFSIYEHPKDYKRDYFFESYQGKKFQDTSLIHRIGFAVLEDLNNNQSPDNNSSRLSGSRPSGRGPNGSISPSKSGSSRLSSSILLTLILTSPNMSPKSGQDTSTYSTLLETIQPTVDEEIVR